MLILFDKDKVIIDQLIELIHSFPLSITFFHTLFGKDLVIHTRFEEVHGNRFERLGEYHAYGFKIFSGGGMFFLDKVAESFSDSVNKEKHQYYSLISELSKLEKRKVSSTLLLPHYTVISQFFSPSDPCGSCWETYAIDNLLKICALKGWGACELQKKIFKP